MGLSYSKSIRFGAVRFNLSGSGIGVSAGIPGLRVGTGPRGAYITGSLGGFRYRKGLGTSSRSGAAASGAAPSSPTHGNGPSAQPSTSGQLTYVPSAVGHTSYDTADVLGLSDATSDAILQTIREQRSRAAFWPFVAIGTSLALLAFAGAVPSCPPSVLGVLAIACVGATLWTRWRDKIRRLTVLFYDLDPQSVADFDALSQAIRSGSAASEFTAVTSRVDFADVKYHSGASYGVSTKAAKSSTGFPDGIIANVAVPMLYAEKTTFAFFPDRVFLIQGRDIGAVEYTSLRSRCEPITMIRSTSYAPPDATIVGHNWKHPNKDGSPDRRFKDNVQFPKCLFSALSLATDSGLNVRFMSSRERGLETVAGALRRMAGGHVGRTGALPSAPNVPQPSAPGQGAFNAGTPSLTLQTIGVSVLAAGLLFLVARGLAPQPSTASTPNAVAVAPDDAVLASLAAAARAQPSFDCRKARSTSERLICNNPELASLDRALAQHFDAVRDSIPEASKKEFAAEARKAWQTRERSCRSDACLTEWYHQRSTQLDAWDARLAASASASSPQPGESPITQVATGSQLSANPATPTPQASTDAEIFHPTQSFCPSPQSDAQRLICSDLDLGAKQLALDHRYDDDRIRLASKIPSGRFSAFLAESAAAARFRDDQCHDKDCVQGWYRGRNEQLATWEGAAP